MLSGVMSYPLDGSIERVQSFGRNIPIIAFHARFKQAVVKPNPIS
jgi:hypothetical protein